MGKDIKRPNKGGKKLNNWLKENKIKKCDLEKELGFPKNSVSKLVLGTRLPSKERMLAISKRTDGFVLLADWALFNEVNPEVSSVQLPPFNEIKTNIQSNKKKSVNFDKIREFYSLKEFVALIDSACLKKGRISKSSVYNWYNANAFPGDSWRTILNNLDPRLRISDWKVAFDEYDDVQNAKEDTDTPSKEGYFFNAEQKVKDYLNRNKADSEFDKFSKKEKRVKTITVQNKPVKMSMSIKSNKNVIKRSNLVKFKDIQLVKGDCKNCLFFSECSPQSNTKATILKFTFDDCSIGHIYKYKEYWIQATPENTGVGMTVRRKNTLDQFKIIEKIKSKRYQDIIIVETLSHGEQMTKCGDFEVLKGG